MQLLKQNVLALVHQDSMKVFNNYLLRLIEMNLISRYYVLLVKYVRWKFLGIYRCLEFNAAKVRR